MNNIGNRLKKLREERELKQSVVADETGISRSSLSQYENGMRPPLDACIALSKYYTVSLDYLVGLSNERQPASGSLPARFADLAQLAGDAALTSTDVASLLDAMAAYYRRGAPCGDWPLLSMRGFADGLRSAMIAAASGNAPALLDGANAAAVAALDVTKMLAVFYEKKGDALP